MKNKILNSKLWISFLLYSLIPILPLLIKLIIDMKVDPQTVTISAAMYIIGAAIWSEKFVNFVVYLVMSFIILLWYALTESTTLLEIFCFFVIGMALVNSFSNYYKFYVMECRPLEIKFAKDLIELTQNSDKQDNT